MPVSPSLHLCLHAHPGAVLGTARPAERDEDPAAELAAWVRNDAVDARGLDGRRIAGAAASMGLHIAALALLISAAAPNLPIAMGESDVDALEIEFLAPAPGITPVASAPPSVTKIETMSAPIEPPRTTKPEPVAPELAPPMPIPMPISEPVVPRADIVEPVTEPPTVATPASPAREEVTSAPTPERPLSTRGKRAQSQYLRDLMAWLARHRVYPAEAKKHRLEGVVQVRFAIDRDGHLLSATVHRSAGAELLDQAALDVLRRADPMPKFPRALERSRLSVTLPIDFSLITD